MLPSRRRHAKPAFAVFVSTLGLPAAASLGAAPFTVVVLPDTQNYTNGADANEEYNLGQTRWIRDNRVSQNIKFVLHVGDLQNPGNPYFARTDDIYEPDFTRPTGFVDDDIRFRRADAAMDILDAAGVPYSIAPGNHDYLKGSGQYERQEPIYYLKYFGPQRYAGKPTFGGSSPADPVLPYAGMNMWHKFEGNGYNFLNIALQFDPNDHDLRWAQKIINENPGLPTLVTTHAYLNNSGYQPGYQNIWDDFVKLNPQIVMTVNGHITGEHRLTDTNIAGQQVHQMLVDYQGTDFPGLYVGGGYLRTMEFDTDGNVVRVKSYSPIANNFLTDGDSQFNLPINFKQRFGLPNGQGIDKSVSFRQGVNGYDGTRDTYVDASAPTTNFGEATIAWVDGDRDTNTAGNQPSHGLIRFDSISGPNAIPAGAIVKSAQLLIHTSSLVDSQSTNAMSLHRLLGGWQEPDATWNSKTNGISADAVEAIFAANDSVVPDVVDEYLSFDVTESVWAWMAGTPNNGWALLPGGGNGWRWDTSESGEILTRPMLNVDFTLAAPVAAKWNAANGNWATAGSWLSGAVPGVADRALIDLGTPGATVRVSSNVPDVFSVSVRNGNVLSIEPGGDVRNTGQSWDDPEHAFRIGDASAGSVVINNGTLANVSPWASAIQGADIYVGIGAGGNGTLTQGGALSTVQGRELRLGTGAGVAGTYNHNGGVAQVNMLLVGHLGGTGNYNLNGGTLNANQLRAGFGNATIGNVNLQAGTINLTSDAYFGVNGIATATHSGGTLTSNGSTYLGRGAVVGQTRGNAQYTLWGSGVIATGADLVIGSEGALGVLAQNGGNVNVTRHLIIGSGIGAGMFADGTVNQNGGATTIGGELRVGVNGTGRYNLTSGTLNAPTIVLNTGGSLTYAGGALNTNSVQIAGAAQMALSAGQDKTLRTAALSIAAGAKLDLTDNRLIVATPGATGSWNGAVYTGIAGLIDAGRGTASNAQWNGGGIVTSDSRAVDSGDFVSIGVARVGDVRNIDDAATTSFGGYTVRGSDTIAMVTWGGDANLDGKINIDDYGQIDANVSKSGTVFGWSRGDFNYDGKINIDDYGVIDANVNRQGDAFPTSGVVASASAGLDGVGAIPEPSATACFFAMTSAALLRRRRRV